MCRQKFTYTFECVDESCVDKNTISCNLLVQLCLSNFIYYFNLKIKSFKKYENINCHPSRTNTVIIKATYHTN